MLPGLDTMPLTGRERELAAVTAAVRAGRVPGVLLVGAAGVGKTRLAQEAAAGARAAGRRVLTVRPTAAGRRLPLAALLGLLPGDPRDAAAPPDTGADPATPAVGLVERGLRGLRRLVEGTPTVLLVDDAHLLDEVSAAVVHQLVVERSVSLLATLRIDELGTGFSAAPATSTAGSVTQLWKDRDVLRIDLAPLSDADTDTLVSAALRGPVEGRTLRRLRQATGGNPLFLRELLIAAREAGVLDRAGGVWRLTGPLRPVPRLVELLRDRLAVSERAEQDALELLALGEPVPLAVAVDLVGAASLETLERRGLLTVETSMRRRSVRLSHPLYGELLRADLPELARLRHSRRLADALDAVGVRRAEDVLRVALWRLDGGGRVHPQRMLAAADQAALIREYALAERLARHAYDSGAGVPAGLVEVRAMLALGRVDEALRRCTHLATEATGDAERAEVAIQHAAALAHQGDDLRAAREVLDAAPVTEPRWREAITASRYYLRSYGLDCSALDPALAAYRAADTVEVRLAAASAAAAALMLAGRHAETAHLVAQVAPLAARHTGPSRVHGDSMRPADAWMRCNLLDPLGALTQAEQTYQASLHPPDRAAQALGAFTLGLVTLLLGRPATALRWATEAYVVAERLQRALPTCRWAAAVRLQAAAQHGAADEVAAAVADLDRHRGGPDRNRLFEMEVARALAWHAAVRTDQAGVRAVLGEEIARHGEQGALGSAVLGALDLVRLGEADLAARLLGRYPPPSGWVLGQLVLRYASTAATDAPELFTVAREFAGYGLPLHAAEAASRAAGAWRAAGEPRPATRAQLFAEVQLGRAEPAATPALRMAGPVSGLTEREREVALAAARGEPTRLIADRLHLAERTVENHLHRAYGKLGVTGRAGLRQVLDSAPVAPRQAEPAGRPAD
ncbi:AAA family ATPase [Micromonospora lutea]|uniref:LuxR family transcriptional regulator n=1 Tax=Micromonospora lutea TaxID=419825 RepID=A0ABQ4J2S2_9ACTN|nr:LuxR family transcriptional regulator [Micromonospora lutea]GIJ24459.1 LuxR family transcriptional regulator [Micromonospora lutea]